MMKPGKKYLKYAAIALGLAAVLVPLFRTSPIPVEMAEATRQSVREYVLEEGTTRLAEDYLIAMPINGTLERIALDEGDRVEAGEIVARVETFDLEQQIRATEALVAQAHAQMTGVDVEKPKAKELEAAAVQAAEARDALAIAGNDRRIAAVQFEQAERDVARARRLHGEGAISTVDRDHAERAFESAQQRLAQAERGVDAAQKAAERAALAEQILRGSMDDNEFRRTALAAEVDRLDAQLAQLRRDRERAQIAAPITGEVLDVLVEDRRALAAGTPLLRLGSRDHVEIECDVLSEEVVQVAEGHAVEIHGKALQGAEVLGSVRRIYPAGFKKISALGIEQQRVRVLIAFDNAAHPLRPGTRVDVRIITAESPEAIAVPERATFRHEGVWAVFRIEHGRARLTPVTIGLRNDDWAEIIDGLGPGDRIVAEPANNLADGTPVTPAG